tara:strand:+ start:220 stop:585 length:366 start_codon:yes stop_codon:yes gene_type:complete
MSGSERRKGAEYEREVASRIRSILGIEAIRSAPLQAGKADAAPDVQTIRGLWVEAKRRRRIAVSTWLDKARSECPQGDVPVIIMREDAGESLVVVSLNDLPTLAALLATSPAVLRLLHSGC